MLKYEKNIIYIKMFLSLIIPLILSILPIYDYNIKLQLGILLGELLNIENYKYIKKYINNLRKSNNITIPEFTNDHNNILFIQIQEYIIHKFKNQLLSCELIADNGDVVFNLTDLSDKQFIDTYDYIPVNSIVDKPITYTFTLSVSVGENNKSQKMRVISISSPTASSDIIRKYIKYISVINKQTNTNEAIQVYRTIEYKNEKKTVTEWKRMDVKTNKTIENTIYSKEIIKDLFDDLDRFYNSEEQYNKLGIPYKRGYFMYGEPGQGKTSSVKAIAKKYKCPIFCIDFNVITTNESFVSAITDIHQYVQNGTYVLLLEDIDRSCLFDTRDNYRNSTEKISLDCLLNGIDGVNEASGQITVITANFPEGILSCKALVRPGRIDKILEFKYCDLDQVKRMYELFYGYENSSNVDWNNITIKDKLSAAFLIKILQENLNNPNIFLHVISDDKSKLDPIDSDKIANIEQEMKENDKNVDDYYNRRRSRGRNLRRYPIKTDPASRLKVRIRREKRIKYNMMKNSKWLEKNETEKDKLIKKLEIKKMKEEIAVMKRRLQKKQGKIINEPEEDDTLIKEPKNKYVKIPKFVDLEDPDNDYDTPAFILNSVDISQIPESTIYSLNQLDELYE